MLQAFIPLPCQFHNTFQPFLHTEELLFPIKGMRKLIQKIIIFKKGYLRIADNTFLKSPCFKILT